MPRDRGAQARLGRVLDDRTLCIPDYDGNAMYRTWGNVLVNAHVGLLFLDFERPNRMRVNGVAQISRDDPLLNNFADAEFLVRVTPREIFANCPRYIHKMKLVERSRFAPTGTCAVPVPGWKKGDWVSDVLPSNDPARDNDREVL